jgi:hypothetical protein
MLNFSYLVTISEFIPDSINPVGTGGIIVLVKLTSVLISEGVPKP